MITRHDMKNWLTWLLRIATGATFIVSGFVKAIDPWGTLYKLQDYMAAMNLPDYPNLLLVGAFILFGYEFCIGIFLTAGCFRRSAPVCAMLFMAVMMPLTLWIAIWNPVADCGCFGDAFLLSNWATFWKNVALTLAIAWLIIYNRRLPWMVRPHLQWIALIASAAFVIWIGLCGYIYQPLIDFRPYPKGSGLIAEEESAESDDEIMLVYEHEGITDTFSIDDDLPDEDQGWQFVERIVPSPKESGRGDSTTEEERGNESTFRIWSDDGENDVTDDVLTSEGRQLILLMPDIKNVSAATTWKINSLYTWAGENDIDMIGVACGSRDEISDWKDLSLAAYPLYTAEDTEIKMVARGNPAVVYIENGKIIWKTTLRALGTEDFLSPSASGDPSEYARNDMALLYNSTALYLIVMILLTALSYVTVIGRMFPHRLSRDDKEGRAGSTPRDTPAQ